MHDWIITGEPDVQSVTPEWRLVHTRTLSGMIVKEVCHVPAGDGYLTELVRSEWLGENQKIGQVFQRMLEPGALSAWHAHVRTTDRLFCVKGQVLVVLFDGRKTSPTCGQIAEYRVGTIRPTLLVVPPGLWHGVQNVGSEPAQLINMVDAAYDYHAPDHRRLPARTSSIPYRFS